MNRWHARPMAQIRYEQRRAEIRRDVAAGALFILGLAALAAFLFTLAPIEAFTP